MLVSAKLLREKPNKLTYAFGTTSEQLNGIFHVDLSDIAKSFIEKSSKEVPKNWALRTMAAIALQTESKGSAPETFVYCPGH